jgi:Uncharacterized protein conserved in bacteria (DUF2087)
VDAVLRAFTEGPLADPSIGTAGGGADHATLRRYLVDHQLLAREGDEYWRSGGWVDVLGD